GHATSPEYGTDGTGDDASGGVGTRPAPPSVNPGHGLRAPCEISATGSRVSIMSRAITGGRVRSPTCVTRPSLPRPCLSQTPDQCRASTRTASALACTVKRVARRILLTRAAKPVARTPATAGSFTTNHEDPIIPQFYTLASG